MSGQRKNYISWDEYFMGIAVNSSMRSKDPSTQVGACIADMSNKVVSIGYNGMPIGFKDEDSHWEAKEGVDSKYLYVVHAELNAILNTRNGMALRGCKLYVTLFPCNECAKAIVQAGIKEIIYLDDKYAAQDNFIASKRIFDLVGVTYRRYEGKVPRISYE